MSIDRASMPPPAPACLDGSAPPTARRREIVVELERPKGLRGRLSGGRAFIRLLGAEISFVYPHVLVAPLVLPAGLVAVAAVDRGNGGRAGAHGRFPVLRRLSATAVVPREHGIEGWLWTSSHGSALPTLADRQGAVPNLALLFTKPLADDHVTDAFGASFLHALAQRSPLGTPAVPGLLACALDSYTAEDAFRQFGVLAPLTDREVPPPMRRHLPDDRPADPSFSQSERARAATSVAPPGWARGGGPG